MSILLLSTDFATDPSRILCPCGDRVVMLQESEVKVG